MSTQGLSNHEVLVMFSATQNVALVHIHYPVADHQERAKTACVHALKEEGHPEAALAIERNAAFLAIDDIAEAIKVAASIRAHSAAMSVNLYWKGMQNDEVIGFLSHAQAERERHERLHHHHEHVSVSGARAHGHKF